MSTAAASSTTNVVSQASAKCRLQAGVSRLRPALPNGQTPKRRHSAAVRQLLNQSSSSYGGLNRENQAGAAANALSNAGSSAPRAGCGPIGNTPTSSTACTGHSTARSSAALSATPQIPGGQRASAGCGLSSASAVAVCHCVAGRRLPAPIIGWLGLPPWPEIHPAAGALAEESGAAPVMDSAGAGSSIVPRCRPVGRGAAGNTRRQEPSRLAFNWADGHARRGCRNGSPGTMAGMPAVANGGRGGSSFGAPRYGVKPKVMTGRSPSRRSASNHRANVGRQPQQAHSHHK